MLEVILSKKEALIAFSYLIELEFCVFFWGVHSDLAVVLSIFAFSFTAFLSVRQYVLRQHVFRVRPGAHLRSAQEGFKAVLVGDHKGTGSLTSGHSLSQLR